MTDIESILQSIKERADRGTVLGECLRSRWYTNEGKQLRSEGWKLRSVGPKWNATSALIEAPIFRECPEITVERLVEAVRVLAEEMNVIRQCGGLTEHDLAVQALQRATEILKA